MEQAAFVVPAINHDDPVHLDAVQPVGFRFEERATLFYSGADQGAFILGVRDRRVIVLEQNLIEAALVVERAKGRFKPLDRVVSAGMVEALVVDAADAQDSAEVAGLGQKAVFVPKPIQIDVRLKRSRLFPILRNVLNLEHRASLCVTMAVWNVESIFSHAVVIEN